MIVLFWILAVVFTVIDRVTKVIAEENMVAGEIVRVISAGDRDILSFSLHQNTGAAFSSFSGKTMALAAVTAVAMILITVYFHRQPRKHILMTVSYAMIIGGGVGNFIDRVSQGYVTDFIRLFPFTFIFNFADICVVIGAVFLIFYYLFLDEKYNKKFDGEDGQADGQ